MKIINRKSFRKNGGEKMKITIPKVFVCPRCGEKAVSVIRKKDLATVRCNGCNLNRDFKNVLKISENIDLFGQFIDWFFCKDNLEINIKELTQESNKQKQMIKRKSIKGIFQDVGFLED